jgi:hypothetical protein
MIMKKQTLEEQTSRIKQMMGLNEDEYEYSSNPNGTLNIPHGHENPEHSDRYTIDMFLFTSEYYEEASERKLQSIGSKIEQEWNKVKKDSYKYPNVEVFMKQHYPRIMGLDENMGLNEEDLNQHDYEMMDRYRKQLDRTHFSGGSMHEDIGTMSSKMLHLIDTSVDLEHKAEQMIYAIKILMKDSVGEGTQASQTIKEIQNELENYFNQLKSSSDMLGGIQSKLENLSDPSHEHWNDESESEYEMPGYKETMDNLNNLTIRK